MFSTIVIYLFIYLLQFDIILKICCYVRLVAKLVEIWLFIMMCFIHLMYTRVLWTTLKIYYIDFIQGILNIYLTYLTHLNVFKLDSKYIKHI
jgi:hypothetical protein